MNGPAEMLAMLDPLALGIVLGGSLLVAASRASRAERAGAFAALKPLFRANPDADAEAALRAVRRVEAIAEIKHIVCVDRVETTGRFLGEAVMALSDARSSAAFDRWGEQMLADRARRHAGRIAFWATMADAAPGMGMIATVMGLVRMFVHMDDPAHIGAPMATALIATLLGLLLANLIAGPIADRLQRLSDAELAWQKRTLETFSGLAHAELDHAIGLQRTLQRSLNR